MPLYVLTEEMVDEIARDFPQLEVLNLSENRALLKSIVYLIHCAPIMECVLFEYFKNFLSLILITIQNK